MSKVLKWLDNYWYHYKWPTIIVAFFLIVGIVLTVQLFSRPNYDAYVMYVGDAPIPNTQYQDILDSLKSAAKDYNKDGEIRINFSKTAYISDEENEMASSVNSVAVQFMSSMIVQPYYIYLISADVYELYKDSGVFVPLSDLDIVVSDDLMYDECAVYFDKTVFASTHAGMSGLGSDTLIVMKNIPYTSSKSAYKAEKQAFDNHVDLMNTILIGTD